MTDEELLVYQLRNPPVMSMALNRDHLYRMMAERMNAAADRIEALGKDRDDLCAEWAAVSQSNYQRAKTAEAKLAECLEQNALLEARLSKALDALRFLEIAATGSGVPHPQERKLLHETIYKARSLLAELEK